jgi:hypothetical protein
MPLEALLRQVEALSEPRIPARHGQNIERARMIGKRLRRVLGRGVDPDEAEWQRLCQALMRGDKPMDKLVAWMSTEGAGRGRAQFEQALEHGIDTVPDAPDLLREFFGLYDRVPDWVDENLLEHGAQIGRMCGNIGAYVLRDGALMGGYQAPGFNRVLVMTGALSKGPAKRLAETSEWWLACTEPRALSRFGEGFKITMRVRLIHALVRRHIASTSDWDVASQGIPINQLDMAATQLAFGPAYLMGARTMGMILTRNDSRAIMHLIRYAGCIIGIEEAFLPQTEREGQLMLYRILLSVVGEPGEAGRTLAAALADEPLGRRYRAFQRLRRRFARERNLSVNVFFLGLAGMRNLGLPHRYIPWFPLLAMPYYAARSLAYRVAPERIAASGRRAQREWVRSLTGAAKHSVGEAAAKIVETV